METEIWKDIPNINGRYQASTHGNVRSVDGFWINKSTGKISTWKGKVLKQSKSKKGYWTVSVKNKSTLCHRVIAQAFIPNPENKPQVNHINGIKTDNRIENLEWATNSENAIHAYKTGLNKAHGIIGEISRSSKLTEEQVIQILKEAKAGATTCGLAKRFNISRMQIFRIRNRKHWKHIGI